MYSGYGNDCAWEVVCIGVHVHPDVCTHMCVHTCAHIKSFPPIPFLSIMFRGCSSFLSVWLCCFAVMANYLDSLLTALRQLNSQMENRRGNLSEMSSLRVELKSDSSPTCVYNRKSFTGKRDGVCLANCRMPAPMLASVEAIMVLFVLLLRHPNIYISSLEENNLFNIIMNFSTIESYPLHCTVYSWQPHK